MKFELIEGSTSFAQAMEKFAQRFARESNLHLYILDQGISGLAIVQDGQRREMPFIDMPIDYWPQPVKRKKGLHP